jgi:hypothetical protein
MTHREIRHLISQKATYHEIAQFMLAKHEGKEIQLTRKGEPTGNWYCPDCEGDNLDEQVADIDEDHKAHTLGEGIEKIEFDQYTLEIHFEADDTNDCCCWIKK